jgi:hypothetical protein
MKTKSDGETCCLVATPIEKGWCVFRDDEGNSEVLDRSSERSMGSENDVTADE